MWGHTALTEYPEILKVSCHLQMLRHNQHDGADILATLQQLIGCGGLEDRGPPHDDRLDSILSQQFEEGCAVLQEPPSPELGGRGPVELEGPPIGPRFEPD